MKRSLAVLFAAFGIVVGCRDPYTNVRIADTATLTQDWSEIRPTKPLGWSKPQQEFSFRIDTPHKRSPQGEVVGPGGQRCVPEVEFVTANGKSFVADAHGFWGDEMYFSSTKAAPRSEPIRVIRIRSSLPLQISTLIWRGYDPAEVKR